MNPNSRRVLPLDGLSPNHRKASAGRVAVSDRLEELGRDGVGSGRSTRWGRSPHRAGVVWGSETFLHRRERALARAAGALRSLEQRVEALRSVEQGSASSRPSSTRSRP